MIDTTNTRTYDPSLNGYQSRTEALSNQNISIKGYAYPFDRKDARGFMHTANNHEAVKSALVQLLLTEKVERVMMPSFGIGLKRYIYEFRDNISIDQIKYIVSDGIRKWEPRIMLKDLSIRFADGDKRIPEEMQGHSIIISISYVLVEDLANEEKLEMRVNFGE